MSQDPGDGRGGHQDVSNDELRGLLVDALEREGTLKVRVAELEDGGSMQMVVEAKRQLAYLRLVHTGASLLLLCASMLLMFKSFNDLAALFRGEEQSFSQYFTTLGISFGMTLVFVANLASGLLHYSIGKTLATPTSK